MSTPIRTRGARSRGRAGLAAVTALASVVGFVVMPSDAHATSTVGGQIKQSEVLLRAVDWYNRAPAYSSGPLYDVGATRQYRTDCSGFVDMALHLNADDDTSAIDSDQDRFTLISQRGASKSSLQPGDVLNDTVYPAHHAVLFDRWEPDHVHFSYYSFGGGSSGQEPPEHVFHASSVVAGYSLDDYRGYRYKNIVVDLPAEAHGVTGLGVAHASGSDEIFDLRSDKGTSFSAYRWAGVGGYTPITGDWNGDGLVDVGVTHASGSDRIFDLSNDHGQTFAAYRWVGAGTDVPITGDWNNDGRTDLGVSHGSGANRIFELSLDHGANSNSYTWANGASWTPITGDWDGNGVTDLGLTKASGTARIFSLSTDKGAHSNSYTWAGVGTYAPITGDWDGNGVTDLGVTTASGSARIFSLSTDKGAHSNSYSWDSVGAYTPITGAWTG